MIIVTVRLYRVIIIFEHVRHCQSESGKSMSLHPLNIGELVDDCNGFVLLAISIAILLSSCISPYDYEDCGVLYDKPTANPLGTSGDIFADTWGDLVMASRSANQKDFFENNACRLSVIKTQGPE